MKTAAYALAAVLVFTGAAFAKDATDKAPTNIEISTKQTGQTYSSRHDATATVSADRPFASKLGIDVNPSFLPIAQ